MSQSAPPLPAEKKTARPTPLYELHLEWRGRIVEFAGYLLPLHYPTGILAEHNHCRSVAALFDVSHMGQIDIIAPPKLLERITPADLEGLAVGRQRYALLTNPKGGIIDDMMVLRRGANSWRLIVNAARKAQDLAHLLQALPGAEITPLGEAQALLALQGPQAMAVLAAQLCTPNLTNLAFMAAAELEFAGQPLVLTRSGYTGEDGAELSLPAALAAPLVRQLLADIRVKPAGLGARDSLRLEAGLCLYGHDLEESTTPIEAGLLWAMGKERRQKADYIGAEALAPQLLVGPPRQRIGLLPEGAAPLREGAEIYDDKARLCGHITSGGFSPTLGRPIAMGYVLQERLAEASPLYGLLRGAMIPLKRTPLPFVPHRYYRPAR
jgi:aminomethyltransferase